MTGWIKLHRSLIDWEWYDDINATRLLIHLLIRVNYEPKKWKGVLIPSGTLVTSFDKLAEETGLTVKQIRVAMQKLESCGEVARERARKGQAITLVKWEKLQSEEEKRASNRADRGQVEGKERATTKELKNNKKDKNKENTIVESIDFDGLLKFINKTFSRQFKVINESTRKKYKARFKDGYTKEDVFNAIRNCKEAKFHKENNFQYCTPKYFSQEDTLEKWGSKSNIKAGAEILQTPFGESYYIDPDGKKIFV